MKCAMAMHSMIFFKNCKIYHWKKLVCIGDFFLWNNNICQSWLVGGILCNIFTDLLKNFQAIFFSQISFQNSKKLFVNRPKTTGANCYILLKMEQIVCTTHSCILNECLVLLKKTWQISSKYISHICMMYSGVKIRKSAI